MELCHVLALLFLVFLVNIPCCLALASVIKASLWGDTLSYQEVSIRPWSWHSIVLTGHWCSYIGQVCFLLPSSCHDLAKVSVWNSWWPSTVTLASQVSSSLSLCFHLYKYMVSNKEMLMISPGKCHFKTCCHSVLASPKWDLIPAMAIPSCLSVSRFCCVPSCNVCTVTQRRGAGRQILSNWHPFVWLWTFNAIWILSE